VTEENFVKPLLETAAFEKLVDFYVLKQHGDLRPKSIKKTLVRSRIRARNNNKPDIQQG